MPAPDDERKVADASFFFDDEPDRRSSAETPSPNREPGAEITPEADLGAYDLADHGPDRAPRLPEPPRASASTPAIERPGEAEARKAPIIPSEVDPPWSRLGEWGPSLLRIALVSSVTIGLVYWLVSPDRLLLPLGILVVGAALVILLAYPIAITLERPVRMTPEHAVRDYYAALSHHVPQCRRMWCLLSSSGRSSRDFNTYPQFQSYWKQRLAELKGGGVSFLSPVDVRIEEFKADRSVGQEAVSARYRLSLHRRGSEDGPPLYSADAETTLSRGPDRMWYLDDGRLPSR